MNIKMYMNNKNIYIYEYIKIIDNASQNSIEIKI